MNEKMEEAWMKTMGSLFLSVIVLLIVVCVLGGLRIVQELSHPAPKMSVIECCKCCPCGCQQGKPCKCP